MGSGASVCPEEVLRNLEETTRFTSKEITKLMKRFSRYDPDSSQGITLKDFLDIPEVSTNPIMPKIAALFLDETKRIRQRDFVRLFSALSSRTPLEDKKEFAFKVLDLDSNGFLGYDEMFSFYRMLLGPSLSDTQILKLVMAAMKMDGIQRKQLSYEDFCELISNKEIEELFTVELQLP